MADDGDGDLIKEVHGDDDLDMSTLGKPVSSLKPVTKADKAEAGQAGEGSSGKTETKEKKDRVKKKKSKLKKSDSSKTAELWSQLDKEIEDVSEDDLDALQPDLALTSETNMQSSQQEPTTPSKERKRGVMVGGLSGGASLGANAPMKEGPKDHSYGIVDGEASARVYDTPELRGAFLHYCKSPIKVSEMHLVHEGPYLAAPQLVQICKDYHLLEPEGKLSLVMVGIIYTTTKADDTEGLTFGEFLDALVSLAFESESNVAGAIQTDWDKKDVLVKSKAAEVRPPRSRPNGRNPSTGGIDDTSGASTPGTGAMTPGSDAGTPPTLSRCGSSFRKALAEAEGDGVVVKKKEKTRFQGIDDMKQSSVLDKVNEVSKIKSMATSRATSVINSRAASRLVSRLPSRGHSEDNSEDEDAFDLTGSSMPKRPPAASTGYQISASFLSNRVHQAFQGYESEDPADPGSPSGAHCPPLILGVNGEAVSPLFAIASQVPHSPLGTPPGTMRSRNSFSGGGAPPLLRSTTMTQRTKSTYNGGTDSVRSSLTKDSIMRNFGADEAEDKTVLQPRGSGPQCDGAEPTKTKSKASVPAPDSNGAPAAAFGSPVNSMRTRLASDSGRAASNPQTAAAAAAAVQATDASTTAASASAPPKPSSKSKSRSKPPAPPLDTTSQPTATPAPAPTESPRGSSSGAAVTAATSSAAPAESSDKTPYELQLARLEAKYKKGAAKGEGDGEQPGSARASLSGAQPIWRPVGRESSSSGKLKIDPAMARVASGRQGRHSGAGDAVDSTSPKAAAAQDVLKSMLLGGPGSADAGTDGDLASPTASQRLAELPAGELLSPGIAGRSKDKPTRAPVNLDADKMAVMASFGSGVSAGAGALTAPAGDKVDGVPAGDVAFDFAKKRRAELEGKLAAIEQRVTGRAGDLSKPTPPSTSPPTASPRTSIAAVRRQNIPTAE